MTQKLSSHPAELPSPSTSLVTLHCTPKRLKKTRSSKSIFLLTLSSLVAERNVQGWRFSRRRGWSHQSWRQGTLALRSLGRLLACALYHCSWMSRGGTCFVGLVYQISGWVCKCACETRQQWWGFFWTRHSGTAWVSIPTSSLWHSTSWACLVITCPWISYLATWLQWKSVPVVSSSALATKTLTCWLSTSFVRDSRRRLKVC